MSHPAPRVYIDDVLMDAHQAANAPVLGGMEITFGVDSDLDMQGVETCTLQMIIKAPENLEFLDNGKILAIQDPRNIPGLSTFFVGRIQRLTAAPYAPISGALIISVSAADTTTDLANETISLASDLTGTAGQRWEALQGWMPEGWTGNAWALRWPFRQHATIVEKNVNYLDQLDKFLRGQIMQRYNASFYTPGVGVSKVLRILQDASQDTAPDKLIYDAATKWAVTAGIPNSYETFEVSLAGSNVRADAGWVKEPEDVLTEVSLQRIDPLPTDWDGEEETKRTPITSRNYLDTAEIRSTYGVRSVEFDTDLRAGAPTAEVLPIFEHWITTASKWRTKTIRIHDADLLTPAQVSYLINPTYRFRIFLVVRGLMNNRPDAENTDLRGFVTGGKAVWTGTTWELELTLGRPPGLPPDGDYWTCQNIATFDAAQCNTVGDNLTCNDFLRIGAP